MKARLQDARCKMITRRKFIYLVLCFCGLITLVVYTSPYIYGDLKTPKLSELTELSTCPACFGNSLCHELYSGHILLESGGYLSLYFNAKNIYNGVIVKTKQKVILKKLAHDTELKAFEEHICKIVGKNDCTPSDIKHLHNVDGMIIKLLQYNLSWTDFEPKKGIVLCPYIDRMDTLIQPFQSTVKTDNKLKMLNIWTLLNINPEPLILQKSKGWPVPALGGLCGRLEVVSNDGEPLSSLTGIPWHKKLQYAIQIIEAALVFTNKHEIFRFYLMDWSLDNIVANEKDIISFVDLEDVIVLDKHVVPRKDLTNWHQQYNREDMGPGFVFSIQNICRHHLSDHNIWAACYILAGDDNPWLYPIPSYINESKTHLDKLLQECLVGENRFHTVVKLKNVMNEILADKNIFRDVSDI